MKGVLSLALKEQDIVFTGKDTSGNTIIQMPITRAANVEDLTSTCLPLAGGTMTGAINFNGIGTVMGSADTSSIQVYGGTAWDAGSMIGVYGKSHASRAGWIYFSTHDGTNTNVLIGKPNGTLTWGGKSVVRSVNGVAADVSGDVTIGGSSAYQIPFASCTTANNKYEKSATITNGASFSLVAGALVAVKFTNGISDGRISTLNVNSTGAKTVRTITGGTTILNHDYRSEGNTYVFVYDGTNWNVVTMLAYRYSEDEGD